MSGGAITAAWIQTIPGFFTAGAAIWAASSWRTQLKLGRQVRHAERCLALAHEVQSAVKRCMAPLSTDERPSYQQENLKAIFEKRLDEAWIAWRRFDNRYRVTGLYFSLPEKDIPAQLASAIEVVEDLAAKQFAHSLNFIDISGGVVDLKNEEKMRLRMKAAVNALDICLRPHFAGLTPTIAIWNLGSKTYKSTHHLFRRALKKWKNL